MNCTQCITRYLVFLQEANEMSSLQISDIESGLGDSKRQIEYSEFEAALSGLASALLCAAMILPSWKMWW